MSTEHRPVVVIEVLDDLERPATVDDIATDDLALEPVGSLRVTRFPQVVARVAKQKVGMPHELVK